MGWLSDLPREIIAMFGLDLLLFDTGLTPDLHGFVYTNRPTPTLEGNCNAPNAGSRTLHKHAVARRLACKFTRLVTGRRAVEERCVSLWSAAVERLSSSGQSASEAFAIVDGNVSYYCDSLETRGCGGSIHGRRANAKADWRLAPFSRADRPLSSTHPPIRPAARPVAQPPSGPAAHPAARRPVAGLGVGLALGGSIGNKCDTTDAS